MQILHQAKLSVSATLEGDTNIQDSEAKESENTKLLLNRHLEFP